MLVSPHLLASKPSSKRRNIVKPSEGLDLLILRQETPPDHESNLNHLGTQLEDHGAHETFIKVQEKNDSINAHDYSHHKLKRNIMVETTLRHSQRRKAAPAPYLIQGVDNGSFTPCVPATGSTDATTRCGARQATAESPSNLKPATSRDSLGYHIPDADPTERDHDIFGDATLRDDYSDNVRKSRLTSGKTFGEEWSSKRRLLIKISLMDA